MATVKVDLPNRPSGSKVDVPGLGLLENGASNQVDDRRWELFKKRNPHVEGDSLTISTAERQKEADELTKAREVELEKATKAQLELIAEAEGVDLSEASNNEERVELIRDARPDTPEA